MCSVIYGSRHSAMQAMLACCSCAALSWNAANSLSHGFLHRRTVTP